MEQRRSLCPKLLWFLPFLRQPPFVLTVLWLWILRKLFVFISWFLQFRQPISKHLYQETIYAISGWGLDRLYYEILETTSNWNPQSRYSTERKYRNDLLAFLQQELRHSGGELSSPIWGSDYSGPHFFKKKVGRGLVDIRIDDEIGIEPKLNLRQKTQINRLVGQFVDYLSAYSCVMLEK